MTHGGFETSAVRPDPTEFWQPLWQTSHFIHREKQPARWELLSEPIERFVFFLSQSYCFSSVKQLFCTRRKLSGDTFLSSAAPGHQGS